MARRDPNNHALADETGNIVESYEYDAWGNVLAVRDGSGNPLSESAIGNRFLFQGREYSWATGLYNFRARWYDPETGRWLSNDPIGISGGLNQYVFCANNPVNFIDPLGLLTIQVGLTGNVGAGTGVGGSAGAAFSLSWSHGLQFGYYASAEGGGHMGMSAGFGIENQFSANGQISDLRGTTLMLGGEGGVLGVVGVNQQYAIDGSGALPISSVSATLGGGGDVHSYVSQTWVTKPLINVPNYAKMAWDWMFNDKQEQQPCK